MPGRLGEAGRLLGVGERGPIGAAKRLGVDQPRGCMFEDARTLRGGAGCCLAGGKFSAVGRGSCTCTRRHDGCAVVGRDDEMQSAIRRSCGVACSHHSSVLHRMFHGSLD